MWGTVIVAVVPLTSPLQGGGGEDDNRPVRNPNEVQIGSLRLENQRLRKIVTDLLLEKAKMEEAFATKPIWKTPRSREEPRRPARSATKVNANKS